MLREEGEQQMHSLTLVYLLTFASRELKCVWTVGSIWCGQHMVQTVHAGGTSEAGREPDANSPRAV